MRFYESLESMVMFCARRPLAAAELSNILRSGGIKMEDPRRSGNKSFHQCQVLAEPAVRHLSDILILIHQKLVS